MKMLFQLVGTSAAVLALAGAVGATELDKLKVLYLGDPGTAREQHFTGFLAKNVGHVTAASRKAFRPTDAAEFDVVLLDWPQSQTSSEERKGRAPLGDRVSWSKPTVLLGSAGLNLAVVWKVRGGSG